MIDPARLPAHDLLRIRDLAALQLSDPLPKWAQASLTAAPWVVVRRDHLVNDRIPVGVRGPQRHQRLAALLPANAIAELITPESLAERAAWKSNPRLQTSPIAQALDQTSLILSAHRLPWGPTGSIGFELATGSPVSHESSDLDLLLRAPLPIPHDLAQSLLASLDTLPIPTDVQVETPAGAFSLTEYASRASFLRLRTCDGSILVPDPWAVVPSLQPETQEAQEALR